MEKNKLYTAAKMLMRLNKFIYTIERYLLAFIMYALVAVLFINVIFRFVLFIPSAWADELARFTFVWLVFLGASTAMYKWEHIDINLIDTILEKLIKNNEKLYNKALNAVKKFAVICTIGYLGYLLVVYGEYLQKVIKLGTQSMFLGVGMVVPMSSVYICSALMLFHAVCYLIIPEHIRKQEG
ncbi:MAG TPA: TRAP transporter small permease [Desulfitobacterium dehalogenans]|uniref:TRAP transporter small permease n=1 Tax=Desulfitobacterium dehalogenans TaxID=36854 RepID=A0A7C7DCB3_9FIRM|nr:TRAP transporter small permease [Desulfitobacterium dehalogenans]